MIAATHEEQLEKNFAAREAEEKRRADSAEFGVRLKAARERVDKLHLEWLQRVFPGAFGKRL